MGLVSEVSVRVSRFVFARILTCLAQPCARDSFRVTRSRNHRFPVGALVRGPFGWVTHGVSSGTGVEDLDSILGELKPSLTCGALGIPG